MTAIGAAIIELKAHCEHTWEVIRALERFAAVVEDAHGPSPTVTPSATPAPTVVATAVEQPRPSAGASTPGRGQRHKKANGKPAKAPAKPATSGKAAAAFTPGAAILSALGGAVAPLTTKALRTKSGLKVGRFYYTLEKLIHEGTVQRLGVKKTRQCTYTLAHQPRPGAAAGTQAAPPAGPSSANGSPHPRVSAAAPGGFEVAWNGTKERNGDTPSLLPPRERRP